jgi:type VI protein secretion system component Hcp
MGFLSRMKMYMKVDGVKGEVVTPSTYIGWIEIDGLTWPGEPPSSGNTAPPVADAKGVFRDYPDFPSKTVKDGDVVVRSTPGKHSPQMFRLVQQGTPTTVDIWAPMPHGKLVKARLTNAIVSAYTAGTSTGGSAPTELITFAAEAGKLRAAP